MGNHIIYLTTYSGTYLKCTTQWSTNYGFEYGADPSKSLTGSPSQTSWLASSGQTGSQRLHFDLGTPFAVTQIYYQNYHNTGSNTDYGIKDFTFWGSNSSTAFNDLIYSHDTDWTQITTSQGSFDQHTSSDAADPKYIVITNSTSYRYYVVKIANNWGGSTVGIRRLCLFDSNSWTSHFPPENSNTYVKATYDPGGNFASYNATNFLKSLLGDNSGNGYYTNGQSKQNNRFHIDTGSGYIITRILFANYHRTGSETTPGAKDFTFWGSNDATAFSTLTYSVDTNWTQLATSSSQFAQHTAVNELDLQYFTVTNSTSHRYYAVKMANNWGSSSSLGIRRIELQSEDAPPPPPPPSTFIPRIILF